jgi:hypothetical protein
VGTPYCAVVCAGTSGNTRHTLLATSTLLLLLLLSIQVDTSAGIDGDCGCCSCAACWYLSGKHDGCTKTSKSSGYVPFVIKGVGARLWRNRCICCCRHTPCAVLTNAENADSALRYFLQATGRLHLPLASWPQIPLTAIAEMSKASSACHQACAAPGNTRPAARSSNYLPPNSTAAPFKHAQCGYHPALSHFFNLDRASMILNSALWRAAVCCGRNVATTASSQRDVRFLRAVMRC